MGEAFLAEDLLLHRKVVIKRMAPQLSRTDTDRQRFLSEAKRAAAINNTHVVQIYDVLESGGELLLILEYVDGGDLRTLGQRKMPLSEFFPIALQIADGVAAAHAAHVVHCDLKPQNILLSQSATVKVLDFGLARPTAREDAATISVAQPKFAGTPGYMAPEMVREEPIDERADIFALGVIFYQLLTGVAPFSSPTLLDTLHRTVHEEPPAVTKSNPEIPPELEWILEKMLAKSRDERYASVREIIIDLTACQRKFLGGSSTVRSTITPILRPRPRSHVALWTGIAMSILVAIAASVLLARYWQRTHVPTQQTAHYRSVAVLPFHLIGAPQSDLEAYADGICVTLTSKLVRIAAMHQLQVTPSSEVRRRSLDSAAAARQQLGADLVIEGQLQRIGQQVRITYNLVDTSTMSQLRSEDIEAPMDNSFALEDKIVDGALNMLDVQLEDAERQSLGQRGTSDSSAYNLFLTGSGYLREYEDPHNVERAIESFQGALLKDANYAQADAALGRAYWRKYQMTHDPALVDAARVSCQRAAEKSPDLPDSHLCLGIIAGGTGAYESAVKELETAVSAEPSNEVALRELASIYEKIKQPAEAEQVYRRGIAARPHYWAGYAWLGGFYTRQARYEEAAGEYREAIEQAPGNATLYYGLGGVYIFQGKYGDAVDVLKKAVELQPTADAYQNLGQAYLHVRNFDEAIKSFKQAITLGNRNYAVYSALGDAYFWSKTHEREAAPAYKQSLAFGLEQQRVNARDQGLNIMLAYNYAALGDASHALDYLQRAQKDTPRDPETMFFAARIYARLRHTAEAADWLQKAIANGYSKADVRDCPDLDGLMNQPAVQHALAT